MAKQLPLQVISGLLMLLLLYFASLQLAMLSILLSALLPLPIILTVSRAGWKAGLLICAAALAILIYLEKFAGLKVELFPLVHMSLVGLTLALLALRAFPPEVIIAGSTLVGFLLQAGVIFFLAYQQGLRPMAYLEQTVATVWSGVSPLVDPEKVLEKELQQVGMTLTDMLSLVAQLTPALLFINNCLVALANYLLGRTLEGQRRWTAPKVPLSCWEAPGWLIFVLIGSGFLLLLASDTLQIAALNFFLSCLVLYFLQGVAILAFSFQRYQVPQALRWTIYLILILIKPAMVLVMLMGLVDLWLDFRRLHQPPSEA